MYCLLFLAVVAVFGQYLRIVKVHKLLRWAEVSQELLLCSRRDRESSAPLKALLFQVDVYISCLVVLVLSAFFHYAVLAQIATIVLYIFYIPWLVLLLFRSRYYALLSKIAAKMFLLTFLVMRLLGNGKSRGWLIAMDACYIAVNILELAQMVCFSFS